MSKILIFSDTHFGPHIDGRLEELTKLFQKYDQIIINGDFWERFLWTFDEFVNSEWNKLFPILKAKNAIYIYGNHDKKEFSDDRVNLFSNHQVDSVELEVGDKKVLITHGHSYLPGPEEKFKWILKSYWLASFIFYTGNILYLSGLYYLMPFAKNMNKAIIKIFKKSNLPQDILITGHTHLAYKSPNRKYYNSGLIRWEYYSYIEIIDNKIVLDDKRFPIFNIKYIVKDILRNL